MSYAERFKEARKRLKLTQKELARRAGYKGEEVAGAQVLISAIEKGGPRGPVIETRRRFGDILGIDLEGNPLPPPVKLKPDGPPPEIPVVALAAAGEPLYSTDGGYSAGDGFSFVGRPHGLNDPYAFGVEVSGDSMDPHYHDGQVVVVDTTKPPGNGDYAVVGLHAGERYIKRWRRKGERVYLESVNPAYEPIETKSGLIKFAYKIVWVRER